MALAMLAAGLSGGVPAFSAPLTARTPSNADLWSFSRAFGGGVETVIDHNRAGSGNNPAWNFLHGAFFRLRLGCDSFDPAQSRWHFMIDVSAPAGDLIGYEERQFDAGVALALGAPGHLVIFDELGKPFRRFALQPRHGRLTSEALEPDDVQRFFDSDLLLIETPRLVLETGTGGMYLNLVTKKPKLACRPPEQAPSHPLPPMKER